MEEDNLKNVDKKILSRKNLVEHLTTKKELKESKNVYTNNENLLHYVLTEKFNDDFEKMLNEEEKTKLTEILSMSNEDLKKEFNTLKEEVTDKLNGMILTEGDSNLKSRLDTALKESQKMPISKYNYYKLQQLRNGL